MKLEFSQQIFEKCPSIKFHENPSSGSRVAPCGANSRNSANTPKNNCSSTTLSWDRTPESASRGQRLTAWTMALPHSTSSLCSQHDGRHALTPHQVCAKHFARSRFLLGVGNTVAYITSCKPTQSKRIRLQHMPEECIQRDQINIAQKKNKLLKCDDVTSPP